MATSNNTGSQVSPMPVSLNIRLSLMMFMQYAIWGAWLPLLLPFLQDHRGFSGSACGHMFMMGGVGALIAPLVAGQIADRYLATERFLGLCHILGGILVWQLSWLEGYWPFLIFSLIYSILYTPTLSLTNSLSFHHIPDRDRDFGRVRVWGTIGWIAAGIGIGQWLLYQYTPADGTAVQIHAMQVAGMQDAFKLSSIAGIIMGIFCFTLPHTPPSPGEQRSAVGEAMGEIRQQPLLTLFLLALPISCIHQFYFVHTAAFVGQYQSAAADRIDAVVAAIFGVGGGGLMTIGQIMEIAVLALIPFFAKSFSRKTFLAIGIIAYGLRMALFAYVDVIPFPHIMTLILGISLHGFSFGCFIFVAFMIVDEETTGDVRASAQSLFNLVIVGIGIIVGSYIATSVVPAWATTDGELSYRQLFSIPMWACVACLAALLIFYPGGKGGKTAATESN